MYRTIIYKNKELFERILESELESTKKYCDEKGLKIVSSGNGSTKTQPEMSIFTISNMDKLKFSDILDLINKIKLDLEKKIIELEFTEDYKVKNIHKENH